MKTLIFASNPILHLSELPTRKPKIAYFQTIPITTIKHEFKPHANPKGFSSVSNGSIETTSKKANDDNNKKKNDENDEIPQEVFNRMIVRILVSVGLPMGLGLAFLHIFGVLKENQLWDVPLWLPFTTTLFTFGASALGIPYGSLSTSFDAGRKESLLGLEEVQRNWLEMWKEEDQSQT
ncbi:uncharacterized protein PAM68-like [Prosopis cineraria]|uniref:uncharacterized protein PAM68-like n=1 Tax=Prosopis cineraria TaxID=364024 RepID=UPI0024102237|nr:uncharacterized protein PAM68-like [Prosopis cineraria]